jgi:hypothetical protein
VDRLATILKTEVKKYAGSGRGANLRLFAMLDDDSQIYAVNAVDYPTHKDTAGVVVLARIAHHKIVIEEDTTDKKLVDALLQQGLKREDIVLAYEGEAIPETDFA